MAEMSDLPIDADDEATWPQLRDRLREIREWASQGGTVITDDKAEVLAILDRPRERA